MDSEQPIGFFDSGVGGTSIWKEVVDLLPNESTVYLADSKNAPYGGKTTKEIVQLSIKNTELLLQLGAKLIVVACNTATTNAIAYLRANYNVSFIGIEPAIKPAALHSKTGKIGVLATKGTLSSSLFSATSQQYAHNLEVIETIGEGLVPLIEQGKIRDNQTKILLKNYIDPMIDAGVDSIVLGCSHYPYLIPLLNNIVPSSITIIDSGEAVARQTQAILEKHSIMNGGINKSSHTFYGNTQLTVLKSLIGTTKSNYFYKFLDF